MHYCAYCGTQLTSDMTRCPTCNQDQRQSYPPQTPYMPSTPIAPMTPLLSEISEYIPPQQTHQQANQQPGRSTYQRNIQYSSPAGPTLYQRPGPNVQPHVTTIVMPRPPAPRWLVTTVILLSLLLILSGFGLLYYTGNTRPAQIRIQATATQKSYTTAVAQATTNAQVQATATALTQQHAVATASVHATAEAKATASALQNMYAQSTSGTPAIDSPLDFEDRQNWDIYPTRDGGGCAFTGNALHSSVFQSGYYTPCIAHATNYSNFALDIQITILKGDEGGIIFRSNASNKNFYSFRIRKDGTYALILTKDDGQATPLINDKSSQIRTGAGQSNLLSLVARGSNFYLYINHQYVGSASDDTYASGSFGVMAIDRQNGTDVAFNNMRVWKL